MRANGIMLCAVALNVLIVAGCSDPAGPESALPQDNMPADFVLSSPLLYDDFDDDALDPELWAILTESGAVQVWEAGQRLEITFPATTSGSVSSNGVISRCRMVGEFDVQVDYELVAWPAFNGVRIGLGAAARDVVARHSSGVWDATTGERYHTNFNGVVGGLTTTADTAGKLRLTRSGATLTGYYWGEWGWVLLSSGSITEDLPEIAISLHGWTHDFAFGGKEVKVAFDDLVVNAGSLSCPEPVITPVVVDIKPGSETNTISLRSSGGVRVAVLSTSRSIGEISDLDAITIDVRTVEFGPGGATPLGSRGVAEDVDEDGDLDLVFRFDVQAAALPEGATEACVSGEAGGKPFRGCDTVTVVEQRGGGRGRHTL